MRPNLFPTLSFLLITSILVHIPVSFCQDNEKYNKCGESIKCGSLNIGYPFYGEGRPEECGFPGFELNCESDVPLITSGPVTYRVLSVDDATQTLTVARNDLWDNLCPTNLYNTTLDFNIFTYTTNDQNITMHYGCSAFSGISFSPPNQFCTNGNSFNFYLTMNEPFTKYAPIVSCNNHITVPVYLEAYQIIGNLNSSADDLTRALEGGFGLQRFAENENCSQCTKSSGRCGQDPVPNSFVCYCADGTYDNGTNGFNCNNTQTGSGSKRKVNPAIIIIIAALVGTSAIAIFSITALYRCRGRCFLLSGYWNMDRRNDQNIEAFVRNWGSLAPKQYSYSEIKKITNSFTEKLGQGGYGSVYKGKLPDGRLVAVKVLKETKGGNGEEFINEVSSISRTSHVNVVTLLGFCYNRKRALIYEFMPNGSLDKFIYKSGSPNADFHLEWKRLYQIVVGIARGLEYLHRGCNTRIVHFDIKPHNILLDEDFCPKISDFGLAKLSEKKESILSMSTARGTVGYIAPEVIFRHFGGVSHKSDVYGYGMMVLEMVGVRKYAGEVDRSSDVYFPQWIYEHLELGKELNIQAVTGEEEEEMSRKMILVGLWCIQTNPSDRPSIGKVVEMLEGSLHSLQIPPKPFLNSPKRSPQRASASFSGSYDEERN